MVIKMMYHQRAALAASAELGEAHVAVPWGSRSGPTLAHPGGSALGTALPRSLAHSTLGKELCVTHS